MPPEPSDSDVREQHVVELVELVRESLIDAPTATLLIEGIGRVGPDADGVTLGERRGRPVLLCPAGGRLIEVAGSGCAAVLSVPTPPRAGAERAVVFFGQLQPSGTYGEGPGHTIVLELAPASIVIQGAEPDQPNETIDLARYTDRCRQRECCRTRRAVTPEQLDRIAGQIRDHTNDHHMQQLVDAAARLTGTPAARIAGAHLATVDPRGVVLEWTDDDGGDRHALPFPEPATDPQTLAAAVRNALDSVE